MLGSIDKKKGHHKSDPKPIKGNTGNCKATGKVTIQENTYFFWGEQGKGHTPNHTETQLMTARA